MIKCNIPGRRDYKVITVWGFHQVIAYFIDYITESGKKRKKSRFVVENPFQHWLLQRLPSGNVTISKYRFKSKRKFKVWMTSDNITRIEKVL